MKQKALLLALLLFMPTLAFSGNMGPTSIPLGFMYTTPSASTNALSTATTFSAFSFIPDSTKTVSKVRFYASAVAGTLQSGDIEVHIYSSAEDGKPNASVASSVTITTLPTGANIVEATGFSYALTAGTQYWAVIKCPNAGAGRYITTRRYTVVRNEAVVGNTSGFGLNFATTTDGSTWTVTPQAAGVISIEYSDASLSGPLIYGSWQSSGVYGAGASKRHDGFFMTTPSGPSVKIRGAFINVVKTGSPTGTLTATLRVGGSTYSSVNSIPSGQVASGMNIFYFPETTVAGGTGIMVTLDNSAEDSSGNTYKVGSFIFRNDSADLSLAPFGLRLTTSTDNAATWTETGEYVVLGGLLMDVSSPFSAAASGGGAYVF